MNILKRIFKLLNNYNSMEIDQGISESMVEAFQSFFLQQATRIRNHIDYENDIKGNKHIKPEMVIKFETESYIKEIDQYFSEKGFYDNLTDSNFHLILLNILASPEPVMELIPAAIRKDLFAGVLKNISRRSNLDMKSIIKFYWEYISVLNKPINNHDPEKIMEYYKDCLSVLDNDDENNNTNFQEINIISDFFKIMGLRKNSDFVKLFSLSNRFKFWFGNIVLTFLLFIALRIMNSEEISDFVKDPELYQQLFSWTVIILPALWFIIILSRNSIYTRYIAKRKMLVSGVIFLESSLKIKPETMRVFLKGKYLFDYRKIRRR